MKRFSYAVAAAAVLAFAAPALAQTTPANPNPATPASPTTTPAMPDPVTPAAPSASASAYSDAQLRSFLAASEDVQPLTHRLQGASATERTQLTGQIRAALARNHLDATTYNAIAAASQSDTALSARINGLRGGASTSGSASTEGSTGAPAGASASAGASGNVATPQGSASAGVTGSTAGTAGNVTGSVAGTTGAVTGNVTGSAGAATHGATGGATAGLTTPTPH